MTVTDLSYIFGLNPKKVDITIGTIMYKNVLLFGDFTCWDITEGYAEFFQYGYVSNKVYKFYYAIYNSNYIPDDLDSIDFSIAYKFAPCN